MFIPGAAPGKPTVRAYEGLRDRARLAAGRPPRSARIQKLSRRCAGVDCETSVGAGDMCDGETVQAIFDVGRDYLVLSDGSHELVGKRQTYGATEFD